jgi:hypothetical protein
MPPDFVEKCIEILISSQSLQILLLGWIQGRSIAQGSRPKDLGSRIWAQGSGMVTLGSGRIRRIDCNAVEGRDG